MAAPSSSGGNGIISAIPPPTPAAPVYVDSNGQVANGKVPVFNTATGIWDPGAGGGGANVVDVLTTKGDLLTQNPSGTYVRLPIGATAGMGLLVASGLPAWALPSGYEFDYVEDTVGLTVTASTDGTAQNYLPGNAVTFDGSTRVKVEFYFPLFNVTASQLLVVNLYQDGADIGRMAAYAFNNEGYGQRLFTPTAGAHTYSIRVWRTAGTTGITAGVGGAGAYMPSFYRLTKA